MTKSKFFISLLMSAGLQLSAETITVWEGSMDGNLNFFSGEANYDNLMGNGTGQGNLSAGDKLEISYSGAIEGSKLWLQNKDWNTYSSSITGTNVDLLTPGDGVFSVNVSQDFVTAIQSTGLRIRRGGSNGANVYLFTKVAVVKGESEGNAGEDTQPENVMVWSGSANTTIRFTPETGSYLENYNKLVGDAVGQANLSAGDKIRIIYTDAAEGDQIWFQNMSWDNISEIDNPMPQLQAGDGSYEFTVNDDAVKAIKEKGIMLRRPNEASYTFTQVEVIKAIIDENVIVPDASETIVWSGSATGDSSVDFRYDPNKSKLLDALQQGYYLKVYMSNVEEDDQIYIKECTNWECLNSQTIMTAGTQVFTMELTAGIIDKIKNSGMIIQRVGNGQVYDFEIRYITIAKDNNAGIDSVEIDEPEDPRNYPAYNIHGQRVNHDTKGLIIINGRKYFNR